MHPLLECSLIRNNNKKKKKVRLITATGSSAASQVIPDRGQSSSVVVGLEFSALIRTTGGVNCQSVRMSGV